MLAHHNVLYAAPMSVFLSATLVLCFTSIVLSFTTRARHTRKLWSWSAVALGAIALILLGVEALIPSTPTPLSLGRAFASRHDHLEALIQMSNADGGSRSVPGDSPYILPDDPAPPGNLDVTVARRKEYRRLYSETGLNCGIVRQRGDIFLVAGSVGYAGIGHSTGYLHCGDGPEHGYSACTSKQTDGWIMPCSSHGDQGCEFRKLADRWYAFYIND
jgi:hypothetical protein